MTASKRSSGSVPASAASTRSRGRPEPVDHGTASTGAAGGDARGRPGRAVPGGRGRRPGQRAAALDGGWPDCCRRDRRAAWRWSRSAGWAGASAPRTATRSGAAARRRTRHRTSWPPRSGTRSGTPGSASTTRSAPSPRRSRWPPRTSRSRSACSTPGTWPATARWPAGCARGRRRPVAADRAPHRLPALRELTEAALGGPRRAGLPARRRPQGGPRRAARRRRPARRSATAEVADALRARRSRAAHLRLLDVRDALHPSAGRRHRPAARARSASRVADLLGLPATATPCCAGSPTTPAPIAYAVDDAWRAADRLAGRPAPRRRPAGPLRRPVARDVVEQDGEAGAGPGRHRPGPDPTLSLRVAAAAATAGCRSRRPPASGWPRTARRCPRPWPPAARAAFVTLLGAGPALVPPGRRATGTGWSTRWLPEWARLRSLPQHNPVHRFTARPAPRARPRARRAALHPRGRPARPAAASARSCTTSARACTATTRWSARRWPTRIAARIGLPPAGRGADRHAGAAAPAAARRGHPPRPGRPADDRRTSPSAVGDTETLELLHALIRADATATGPAAWSAWKERLIADLVRPGADRAGHRRGTAPPPASRRPGAGRRRRCRPST